MSASPARAPGGEGANTRAGMRLERLEVLGWGPFVGQVATLTLGGGSGLLTGDIGAGTSALVDAIAALLAPSQHPAPAATHGVILGVFRNGGGGPPVTLAQVFRAPGPPGRPQRSYVGAERELTIARHLAGFDDDPVRLHERLQALGCRVDHSARSHEAWLRQHLGTGNEPALRLFRPRAAVRSSKDLTGFVRAELLAPLDVEPRVRALIDAFEPLERAHAALVEAMRRVERLAPLMDDARRHADLAGEIGALRECRDALPEHFARITLELVDERLVRYDDVIHQLNRQIERLETRCGERRAAPDAAEIAGAGHADERLAQLEAEIHRLEGVRNGRRLRAERHGALVGRIGDVPAADEAGFIAQRMRLRAMRKDARERAGALDLELDGHRAELHGCTADRDALLRALARLRLRRSGLDEPRIRLRERLCAALGIEERALPFAGELLRVRAQESDWAGAAERVLHDFARSLLVPDAHFAAVAAWVSAHRLGVRLAYFHVRAGLPGALPELHRDALARKLAIEPTSPLHDWMARELAQRFDIACCRTLEQFERETRAVLLDGRIKDPSGRHEKNDRHRIEDRSHDVLGADNIGKVAALEASARGLEERVRQTKVRIAEAQERRKLLGERLDALARLDEYVDFEDLDWSAPATRIERLRNERRRLLEDAGAATPAARRPGDAADALAAAAQALDVAKDRRSRILQRRTDAMELRRVAQARVESSSARAGIPPPEPTQRLAQVRALTAPAGPSLEACDGHERAAREHLQRRIEAAQEELARLRERILLGMAAFEAQFGQGTGVPAAGIEAVPGYRALLERLRGSDLPRLEAAFATCFDTGIARALAELDAGLARAQTSLRERIAGINEALCRIEHRPGHRLLLEVEASPDAQIQDFQAALRAGMESTGAQPAVPRFQAVKRLVEGLSGRNAPAEDGRHRAATVTDVRNWLVFEATERGGAPQAARAPGADADLAHEAGADRIGCTLLAAGLAAADAPPTPRFRLVLLEADDDLVCGEIMHHALGLLRQLELQCLAVGPLRMLPRGEPGVWAVGIVHDEGDAGATLHNLTLEEYRARQIGRTTSGPAPSGTGPEPMPDGDQTGRHAPSPLRAET